MSYDPFEQLSGFSETLHRYMTSEIARVQEALSVRNETRRLLEGVQGVAGEALRLDRQLKQAVQGPRGALTQALERIESVRRSPAFQLAGEASRIEELSRRLADVTAPTLSFPPFHVDPNVLADRFRVNLAALGELQRTVTVADVAGAAEDSIAEAAPGVKAPELIWKRLVPLLWSILLWWLLSYPEMLVMEARLDELDAAIDQLRTESQAQRARTISTTHVTTRSLLLHNGPASSSEWKRRLEAGSGVTVIGAADAWFLVVNRDPFDGTIRTGWLYGRYLRPIDAAPRPE